MSRTEARETPYDPHVAAAAMLAGGVSESEALAALVVGDGDVGATWGRVDLSEALAAEREPVAPTIGTLQDGAGIFYAGRVNGIAGEPAGGKTWVALLVAAQEIARGQYAMFIDMEDDAAAAVDRLRLLGVADEGIRNQLIYVQPQEKFGKAARSLVTDLVCAHRPSIVIIDSTGEALAIDGVRPNADDEVAEWFARLPRRLSRLGPAVVVLDHVAKVEAGRWPIGSQRKLAAINGAQYTAHAVEPFSREEFGHSLLVVSKDRPGWRSVGSTACGLDVTVKGGRPSFELTDPDGRLVEKGTGARAPAKLRTLATVSENPGLSTAEIATVAGASVRTVQDHLRQLGADGDRAVINKGSVQNPAWWPTTG